MYVPKVNFGEQVTFSEHRSGWAYALNSLRPLHSPKGIEFHGFVEDIFAWNAWLSIQNKLIPIDRPWIGFIHNPHNMPLWFDYCNSPQTIFKSQNWIDSLATCKGLFCLSKYHKDWLEQQLPVPIVSLIHPTEIPPNIFSIDKFNKNQSKKVIQIGWWLRHIDAIYRLPLKNQNITYSKLHLLGGNTRVKVLMGYEQAEKRKWPQTYPYRGKTAVTWHMPNGKYDALLEQNIALAYLYDSSANNAIIECIARATPILVNRLPAVIEYLGEDYPFYFTDLGEAAEKADNIALIEQTHKYMLALDTRKALTPEAFRTAFAESSIYQSLANVDICPTDNS